MPEPIETAQVMRPPWFVQIVAGVVLVAMLLAAVFAAGMVLYYWNRVHV